MGKEKEVIQFLEEEKTDKEIIDMFSDIVPNTNMIAIVPPLVQKYYNVNAKNPDREANYIEKTEKVFDEDTIKAYLQQGCLVVGIGHGVDNNYPDVKVGMTVYTREGGDRGIRVEDGAYACIILAPHNIAYIQDNIKVEKKK